MHNQKNKIGHFTQDSTGLPCFCYEGALPYKETLSDGRAVKLPCDPWFILGNYFMTIFAHVSGEYELISGQRAWGRINQGNHKNSGNNSCVIEVTNNGNKVSYNLTGLESAACDPLKCRRTFGCGFANYEYGLKDIYVRRNMSVKPSDNPKDGTSSFLLTLSVKNSGIDKLHIKLTESITADYTEIQFQSIPKNERKIKYTNTAHAMGKALSVIEIAGISDDALLTKNKDIPSACELFPPALFMKLLTNDNNCTKIECVNDTLCAVYESDIEPGNEDVIKIIAGFCMSGAEASINEITNTLMTGADIDNDFNISVFSNEWKKVLPKLHEEKDEVLKNELIWHAHTLEAMATYSEIYNETKIPQGTIYDYDWGSHASARDHFQHALPLVYYNPALAKSVLKYMFKRTTAYGEIRLIERGVGYTSNERYFTSDQQLFFFLLFAEYLRVTKDYGFLNEEVLCCPVNAGCKMTVLKLTEACFTFLRDEIGVGEHGLVRLLNSDWNDEVYYIVNAPYNNVVLNGESHMNSAMAAGILQKLILQLNIASDCNLLRVISEDIRALSESMSLYRKNIWEAFDYDMAGKSFPKRMYFNDKSYGDDNMFLEPMGYTLWINEFDKDRKKCLYDEMKKRVYAGEKLGAREQESPEFEDEHFDKGSRENGGFWWALNGPVIIGVNEFDKDEAWRLLRKMTFSNFAKAFPDYWTSYWSASDNVESSLILEEGLPDQSRNYSDQPVFCAHPHAWILYCYFYLREE